MRQPEPEICECDRWVTQCMCHREQIDKTAEAKAVAGEPREEINLLDYPEERYKRPGVCDR